VQAAWPRPKLFDWLQREGSVAESEMHRVFNCGIGMVVVVARENAQQAVQVLREAGEPAVVIGVIKGARRGGSGDDSGFRLRGCTCFSPAMTPRKRRGLLDGVK
jgi:phosphoribosylaminoimidazole (AIR) synthetase